MAEMTGRFLIMLVTVAAAAQEQQNSPRPGWPCVPGRAVDPSYVELAESTGGQLFLFQKGEVQHSAGVMMAPTTHPATVLRSVGQIAGTRVLEFAVESGVQSLLVLASMQCRAEIAVLRPGGAEVTASNAAENLDLKTGRIIRVDLPEPGIWKVKLRGEGLYVTSVRAKAPIALSEAAVKSSTAEVSVDGDVSSLRVDLLDAAGELLVRGDGTGRTDAGTYRVELRHVPDRYRILVTGRDALGQPFQRVDPRLLRR